MDQPSVIPRVGMAGAGEAAPAGSSDLHIFIRMAAAAGCSLCQFAQSWSSHCPELMGAGLSQPTSRDLQLSLLSPHLTDSPDSSGTHSCSPTPICSPDVASVHPCLAMCTSASERAVTV